MTSPMYGRLAACGRLSIGLLTENVCRCEQRGRIHAQPNCAIGNRAQVNNLPYLSTER